MTHSVEDFQPGQIVTYNPDGPKMRVTKVKEKITCTFWDYSNNKPKEDKFDASDLIILSQDFESRPASINRTGSEDYK